MTGPSLTPNFSAFPFLAQLFPRSNKYLQISLFLSHDNKNKKKKHLVLRVFLEHQQIFLGGSTSRFIGLHSGSVIIIIHENDRGSAASCAQQLADNYLTPTLNFKLQWRAADRALNGFSLHVLRK